MVETANENLNEAVEDINKDSQEGTLAALRAKHNSNMAELGEQIDSINKSKAKAEKDKAGMERGERVERGKSFHIESHFRPPGDPGCPG